MGGKESAKYYSFLATASIFKLRVFLRSYLLRL